MAKRLSLEARFFANVDINGPVASRRPDLGRCWLWTGPLTPGGYGQMWVDGRPERAHRVGWRIAWDCPPPPGLGLRHFACETKECVNPAHIRPRSAAANVLGTRNVAAWYVGRSHCMMGHPFDRSSRVDVPGGWACRTCLRELAKARRAR